jgi:LacI family transcriptional regulator
MDEVRIGLILPHWFGFGRAEMRGVIAYARENHLPWVFAGGSDAPATLRMLRRWKPHALIGGPLPHADVPNAWPVTPHVQASAVLDDDGIGRMAAEHLLERGFRNLAYLGERGAAFSPARRDGFRASWQQAVGGAPGATFHTRDLAFEAGRDLRLELRDVAGWLKSLPKPLAIMASRDQRARQVVEACRHIGLRVPDDVAVVGVDNDDLFCELCEPPLSSVAVPWEQIGRAMAARVHALLRGVAPPAPLPLVRPSAVVVRRSSDVYAIRDEAVRLACRYIREHAHERCSMVAVARAAGVSRRVMERGFREELGVSPHRLIERVRLRAAQRLLRDTTLPVSQVAERCGFSSSARLITLFRRLTKMTPGAYRAASRPQ